MGRIICIDARLWGIRHTGIGRYVENLIDNLPGEVILIVPPDLKNEPKLAKFTKYYARFHPYSFLAQLEMLWILSFIRPDLLHVPHFTILVLWPGRMVVTIHDLIKHISKGHDTTTRHPLLYWLKYFGYLIIVWLAVHRASHIIVPAKYWRDILIKKYGLNPAEISVIYEGVAQTFLGDSLKETPFKSIPRPFVVYTGNLYPHKNILVLIRAVELAKVNLAIVCARSVFADRLPTSPRVFYLGQLSDEQLVGLYQQAAAFTFPSLIEGFGLPGLEAMAVGLPVIAARASCLPEIYGDAALFFSPHDPVDLADKIQSLLIDKKLREMLIAKGQMQVKKYSWATMAAQTWEIYQAASR
ncbi:MAG: Glycosyl transferase, group 1 [Candidatus Amesbacteria bacterium GW2011_GWB1_47_26]|uniref:Glycosyl transferase, group 1 n=1 Tax=Candidatus Amesbacteria bacterium GW2011_GWC2_45_19 TaxID=1618366 RepID=A0A0G1M4T0_9BACT|nr:MAG: Glycosyl transferase, group 1 [Candidatus Amesbacteria bacterium GW2011_GWC2_45_19]KKU38588.1 MAG: Glycosyl transferase, group 1 [Candidatus Amesbacteria bacterium GW2011_GWA1_46_35]KKU69458.1 MAG: Glycosyl transferase, group 1 [Microgenomates group bacterium GW2011_GWC1_47_20]KKU74802.1 MAG: Glycosyl transferase, group 1 [Candidatus Amesbacteria bacterium GW2011_GWB1_47_26]KKU79916.1 MAG: Glycosyl transferase, group 1 [Candidatus Amesbacteria bacterium GW2011_GWA2_47_70]